MVQKEKLINLHAIKITVVQMVCPSFLSVERWKYKSTFKKVTDPLEKIKSIQAKTPLLKIILIIF